MVLGVLLVYFKKALEDIFKSEWISNNKYKFAYRNQFANYQDLRTINQLYWVPPCIFPSTFLQQVKLWCIQFSAPILDLSSSLKVDEMLFLIIQSSLRPRVTETYKPANYMPFHTQLQIFQHSSKYFKLTSFIATLWPPLINAADIVSKQ